MSPNYIDLHTHSTFSDGTKTPAEIVQLAQERNLAAVALTDHDTVLGIPAFLEAGKTSPIETIAGIELAAEYEGTEIHIVGLFVDPNSSAFQQFNETVQKNREKRNLLMVEKLTSLGYHISYEDVLSEAGGHVITRAHFARALVHHSYVSTKNEAFEKILGNDKAGYVKRILPSPESCLDIIAKSGGISVLAHPTLYHFDEFQILRLCTYLKSLGLTAVETIYTSYSYAQQQTLKKIAQRAGLLSSGGSDYHGENKPGIFLGVGKGNLRIPLDFLEQLKKRRKELHASKF
ncbi:MAG: PHP domain-containing protein [Clostridiales bacterium]|nr:PHP domain-containing protein [Clostridiales bacterium]